MKTFFSNIWYMLKRVQRNSRRLMLIVALEVGLALFMSWIGLRLTQDLINMVAMKVEVPEFIRHILLLIAGYSVMRIGLLYLMVQSATKRSLYRLGEMTALSDVILKSDFQLLQSEDFEKTQMLALNTVNNSEAVSEIFPENMKRLLEQVAKLALYGVLLSRLDWRFMALIGLLLLLVISYRFFQHSFINSTREERSRYNDQYRYIERVTSNFSLAKDVRLFRVSPWFQAIFKDVLHNLRRMTFRRGRVVLGGQILSALLILLLTLYGYYVLIQELLSGAINIGQLMFYIGAISLIAVSSSELINVIFDLMDNSEGIGHLRRFLNYPPLFNHEALAALPSEIESIEFVDVSFRYPKSQTPVFENFNLKLQRHEKVAIVGVNGAGKTSLVKLLCNLYKPDSGKILINGIDNQLFDVSQYYDLFSVVFQDQYTLPITLKAMVLQNSEYDESKYRRVLDQSNLNQVIAELPLGDETPLVKEVDSQAVTLSGGQMQKLKLAQALYKDGPILILDEPTSALDPLAESEVYQQYHQHSQNKLSLFITHRLATTQFCDRILYIEDGKVLEDGSHRELMARGGKYQTMYDTQAYYYQEGELA